MTEKNTLYTRDLLYPTDVLYEPGSVHVDVLSPNKHAKIPIIIECKTEHSPVKYLDSIIRIMQADIFDRIFVNVKSNATIFIKNDAELKMKYDGKKYLKVVFEGEGTRFEGVDEIDA